MTEIQKKLLEIAKEYIGVCEKLNLRYFAIGGTTLGAVRHGGFIPWDDDMDFGMPRKDYDIFVREAQKHFKSGYFVQTYKTDKEWLQPFCKVRDSNTTAIESVFKNLNINHGLWLDIFPLDGLPYSERKKQKLNFIDFQILRRRFAPNDSYRYNGFQKVLNFVVVLMFPKKSWALRKQIRMCKKYNFETSEYFWWNWFSRPKKNYKTEWFKNYLVVKFEDLELRIPESYEQYLSEQYGDWKKLPPIEQRITDHAFEKLDLNSSYLNHLNSHTIK